MLTQVTFFNQQPTTNNQQPTTNTAKRCLTLKLLPPITQQLMSLSLEPSFLPSPTQLEAQDQAYDSANPVIRLTLNNKCGIYDVYTTFILSAMICASSLRSSFIWEEHRLSSILKG
ncbi:hypothetical protein EFI48_07050 [Aeromonas veronii]|uniref:Uncharacterized protein n=1 Tax=Aeromonas veronii TaxID=654 RepID=A0AAN1QCM6_AERVE|nr:hypothetical protein EFI48_07050 [Aeromonas veronii]